MQAVLAGFGEQADDEAGIDAARQQASDGHVGHQPALDGDPQGLENRVLPVLFGPVGGLLAAAEVRFPVGGRRRAAVRLDRDQRCRWHLGHSAQDRARRRHDGVEAQVVVQCDGVDPGVDVAAGEQGGQRRREANACGVLGEVQRLDAEPVAAEEDPAAVALDDREGEHPLQVVDEAVAPVVVGLEEHLGVAVGEEAVAVPGQLLPQFLVVVDAAVPGDGQAEVRIDHRLGARFGQVDDLQATVAESHSALRPHARRVRSPGRHRFGHGRDGSDIRGLTIETHFTGGSAHLEVFTQVDGGENAAAV